MSWASYPKVYAIGHPAVDGLLGGDVIVEEKVDGSQFSFGVVDGILRVRSKNQEMPVDAPQQMFERAVEVVTSIRGVLRPGWIYRCEYLQSPQHNCLTYARVPDNHLVLLDVEVDASRFLPPEGKDAEALRLGISPVPVLSVGRVESPAGLKSYLERESFLGGSLVEGVVVKNYARFGKDGKVLMGKYVSEAFKERHKVAWKASNPTQGDVLTRLGDEYATEARWRKAVQHLTEAGMLKSDPSDIGMLMKEVERDFVEECKEEIAAELWKWARGHLIRRVRRGLPEWYKDELLARAFGESAG